MWCGRRKCWRCSITYPVLMASDILLYQDSYTIAAWFCKAIIIDNIDTRYCTGMPIYEVGFAPMVRMAMARRVHPLVSLKPYQGIWTIRVRLTSKGNIRSYKHAGGEGHTNSSHNV
ncbi:hypothetical protein V6N13_035685 [Hibiscus sabdariffa]|uniref:Uncharacterized protein n=1 Tax=Hibiscus sabdariffa TaxID=183260 RepID=A0ABR2S903_9ROSI